MLQTVIDRVADTIRNALDKTHHTPTTLSNQIGVSRNTIYSWRDKETKNVSEKNLEKIADVLPVDIEWLKTGKDIATEEKINEIERRVAEKGDDYKGLDQTLSDVESKARGLKRDLESLLEDIDKLRSRD